MNERLSQIVRAHLAPSKQAYLRRHLRPARMGNMRRTEPFSPRYGAERGTPIDRYYIERFLAEHQEDICGRALEVKESTYIESFGHHLTGVDVLDIEADNPAATVVADLAAADSVPSRQFNCFVLTQTLQLIYDWRSALEHARRILQPGGVLLVTVPAVSRVDRTIANIDYWRFTPVACRRMFGEVFGEKHVTVHAYGNVLSSTAFLMGMAAEELTREELDTADEYFPMIVGIRGQAD